MFPNVFYKILGHKLLVLNKSDTDFLEPNGKLKYIPPGILALIR
jgi:hypothetical protein